MVCAVCVLSQNGDVTMLFQPEMRVSDGFDYAVSGMQTRPLISERVDNIPK